MLADGKKQLFRPRDMDRGLASGSTVVTISAGSTSKPPLFCVHAEAGDVSLYYGIARHLAADQRVIGLTALAPSADAQEAYWQGAPNAIGPDNVQHRNAPGAATTGGWRADISNAGPRYGWGASPVTTNWPTRAMDSELASGRLRGRSSPFAKPTTLPAYCAWQAKMEGQPSNMNLEPSR